MIGNKRRMDHVGIRVREPDARLQWYAEKLGFVHEVRAPALLLAPPAPLAAPQRSRCFPVCAPAH